MSVKPDGVSDFSMPEYPEPAFPRTRQGVGGETIFEAYGMTLRDYFASTAPAVPDTQTYPIKKWYKNEVVDRGNGMKGLREVVYQESWAERSARWAFEYADAMLAERAKS